MLVRSITMLFICLGLVSTSATLSPALAEEKTKPAAEAAKEKPKLSKEQAKAVQRVNAIRAAYTLVDIGRRESDAHALLAAARIIGRTPVANLKSSEDDKEEKKNEVEKNPQESLREEAKKLVAEAIELAKDLPEEANEAVKVIAKNTLMNIDERSRGVVGNKSDQRFLDGNGTWTYSNVPLNGTYTRFFVNSFNGADMDIRVVGALTGILYGEDNSWNPNASVEFSHLPVASVNVFIRNNSDFGGTYRVTAN